MSADLAVPLRTALLSNSQITALLSAYQGSFPIFTRRPAPSDAVFPIIMVSPDIAITDQDGISDSRPIQTRDIIVYGSNERPQNYRNIETLAHLIRRQFHRQRNSITVTDWHVITITASGPTPAPTDDDQTIARAVSLNIQLAQA